MFVEFCRKKTMFYCLDLGLIERMNENETLRFICIHYFVFESDLWTFSPRYTRAGLNHMWLAENMRSGDFFFASDSMSLL